MGTIKREVREIHLTKYGPEEPLLTPFLSYFDVTWGSRETGVNTQCSFFHLKPEEHTTQTFGIENEVLLAYAPFPKFEQRTLQLIAAQFNKHPTKNRVELLCYVLISDDPDIVSKISNHIAANVESPSIVPFYSQELTKPGCDIRGRFNDFLFSRDLFDIHQPLTNERFFFGRTQFVKSLIDRITRQQNVGLFGLRKSGKTSVLNMVDAGLEAFTDLSIVRLDAQNPAIHSLRWWELLEHIEAEAAVKTGTPAGGVKYTEASAAALFTEFIKRMATKGTHRLVLVIDEFEHITTGLVSTRSTWNSDFLPFWQTIRAVQNTWKSPTCAIAAVNPYAAEISQVNGADNPLLGLLPNTFIPPFTRDHVRQMVRKLGRYMGMKFDEDVYEYLRERYSGHPLLIRTACSWMHRYFASKKMAYPITVSKTIFETTEVDREVAMIPFIRSILDMLARWYPNEYEMLRLLAHGEDSAYNDFAKQSPEWEHHLREYGLIEIRGQKRVYGGAITSFAKTHVAPPPTTESVSAPQKESIDNIEWERIAEGLVQSRTFCQERARQLGKEPVFNDDMVRIGSKLAEMRSLPLSTDKASFENAINAFHQLFVDSTTPSRKPWIRSTTKKFFSASELIRGLRHWLHHPKLDDKALHAIVMDYIAQRGGSPVRASEWSSLHLDIANLLVEGLREITLYLK